ncbi:MAG: DUF3990 domain-containing protein [Prevotellaceae bacterium]|jgi:hypothetical protein|nr:DUF3990 domain-containing protein [Prevotellaceae bacterium]
MQVYHGSYTEIFEVDLSQGRENRDFGRGFYVTNIRSQAEFWAKRQGKRYGNKGVVTEFQFFENAFEHWNFKTLQFADYSEKWLDFVVLNRNLANPQPAHDYDIVEGPVADDAIAEQIGDYLDGAISKSDFLKELTYHKKTHQICFCTLKSLQVIKRVKKNEVAYKLKEITKPIIRCLVSERGLDKADAVDKLYNSKTFTQLADKTTQLYEKNWSEIYKLLLDELAIK